jgi:hypothetical protein
MHVLVRRFRFAALLFAGAFVASVWLGAAELTRAFDIPAGLAEKTLKQFASQSGMEVLYSTDAAHGVRTNAVKGRLAVREAVTRLLLGTQLYVIDDRKGVLRIARAPDPNGQRAAPKTTGDRPKSPSFLSQSLNPQHP